MSEQVKITGQQPDRTTVVRTWDVEGPDWTPKFKSRAIAVRRISVVYVDGVVSRIAVTGPYRMKSGKTAEPKFEGDQNHIGGTGDPDYRFDYDRMTHVNGRERDTIHEFPAWVWDFIEAQEAP
jgi:hypothetical protein